MSICENNLSQGTSSSSFYVPDDSAIGNKKIQLTFGDYCHYRNCRHTREEHGKSWLNNSTNKRTGCRCKHCTTFVDDGRKYKQTPEIRSKEFYELENLLLHNEIFCKCGERLTPFDMQQEQEYNSNNDHDRNNSIFVHCPHCKFDTAAWILHRKIAKLSEGSKSKQVKNKQEAVIF